MSRRTRKQKQRTARRRKSGTTTPSKPADPLTRASTLFSAGDLKAAARIAADLVEANPRHADALHLLGLIAMQSGESEQAVELLIEAIRAKPDAAMFYSDLGLALVRVGRCDDAASAYSAAIEVDQNCVAAHYNYAALLSSLNRTKEALQHLQQVVQLDPQHFRAHNNLGSALQELGRLDEAAESFRQAQRISPDSPVVLTNLADCLHEIGDVHSAEELYRRSLGVRPDAGVAVKLALCAGPVEATADDIALRRRKVQSRLTELAASRIRLQDPYSEVGKAPFYFAYHGENDRTLLGQLADFYLQSAPMLGFVAPHCERPSPPADRQIRIGFVSRYLHDHPVGRHFGGIVSNLPDDFTVTALRFAPHDDVVSRAIANRANAVITLPDDLIGCQQEIAELELDILVYAEVGMDPLTYFLAYSRLAHMQCVLPGHPVTSGIPTLDYYLSSDDMEPPDADSHYSESLVRLRHVPNYFAKPNPAASGKSLEDFGLSTDHHNYLCVQMLFKIHPDFDQLIARLLRLDPLGRIVLFGDEQQFVARQLRSRFSRQIADVADRIVMLPRLALGDFLELLTLGSCVLDTIHFSGGTTTTYALGVGAPVVTLPGRYFRGRTTFGLLRKVGAIDCIASNADEYARIAFRLASDPEFRGSVQKQILAGQDSIFEQPGAVAEIADFFRHTHREKEPPGSSAAEAPRVE